MFQLIRLVQLVIWGIQRARVSTKPASQYYPGIKNYDKAFFDSECPFQFYKCPLQELYDDIKDYDALIKPITLVRRQSTTFFEIYETHLIGPRELAMNVRACYSDFIQTGINSQQQSVVTENYFFVLCVDTHHDQLKVMSSIESNITEKNIKKDFGEYLIKYLLKVKKEAAGVVS